MPERSSRLLLAGVEPKVFVPEPGFRKLFDGRTLAGWEGRPGFWSVEDRAIVGRTTKENPLEGNTFLFAKAAGKNLIVDDFELRLSYRITADNDAGFANSGIQYRSRDRGDFVAAGYQADIEAGPMFSGILYDEAGGAGGRGIMANRGEKVTWTSDGKKEVTGRLGSSEEIQAKIKKDDWNEYVVIARGNHLQHFINGVPTVDVFDEVEVEAARLGDPGAPAPRGRADDRPIQGYPHQVAPLGGRVGRRQRAGRQGVQARPDLLGAEGRPRARGWRCAPTRRAGSSPRTRTASSIA